MKKKKIVSLMCILGLCVGAVAGCGGSGGAVSSDAAVYDDGEQPSDAAAYEKYEETISSDNANESPVEEAGSADAVKAEKGYISSLGKEREREGTWSGAICRARWYRRRSETEDRWPSC